MSDVPQAAATPARGGATSRAAYTLVRSTVDDRARELVTSRAKARRQAALDGDGRDESRLDPPRSRHRTATQNGCSSLAACAGDVRALVDTIRL